MHLEFADLKVHLETEDEYPINAVGQYALDILAQLIKNRVAYDNVDSDEPDGDKPDNEIKPLSVEHKTEVAKMYQ